MFEWKSILIGALLPYIVVGVAIGIRQKSVKAGAQVAWAMAVMTVGMFSKNLKITSGPDD